MAGHFFYGWPEINIVSKDRPVRRNFSEGVRLPSVVSERSETRRMGGAGHNKVKYIMYYVYILRSQTFPEKNYIGQTDDVVQRLYVHNTGGSPHTAKYKPWSLVSSISFESKEKAIEFEKYLKSGSGRAFVKKRFL